MPGCQQQTSYGPPASCKVIKTATVSLYTIVVAIAVRASGFEANVLEGPKSTWSEGWCDQSIRSNFEINDLQIWGKESPATLGYRGHSGPGFQQGHTQTNSCPLIQ